MDTRRQWIVSTLATWAVTACGNERTSGGSNPARAAAASPSDAKLEPWEPIDPAFDGCAGG